MGNCFGSRRLPRKLVSFPVIVQDFVRGGDLIFFEELDYFDDYTRLNRQVLHFFKRALRTKENMDVFYPIKQWCRIGIVIDSDIEQVKYILMLGPEGFYRVEYMTQILEWKQANTTFAIKRLTNPLSVAQTDKLRQLARFLCTIDGESGKYRDLFTLQEDQLINVTLGNASEQQSMKSVKAKSVKSKGSKVKDDLKGEAKGKNKKAAKADAKNKGKDDDLPSSEEEPDTEEIDRMEQLDLIKKALQETRRILENIDENGSMYAQFYDIFLRFCGKLTDDLDEDDDESVNWSQNSGFTTRQISVDQNNVLEILAIPQFVKYFKVATDDENFFEDTVERLSDLAMNQQYVDQGLPFDACLNELSQADFFLGCELTDKEPVSVMQAQITMQILEYLQLISPSERQMGIFKDVNDLDEIAPDEAIEMGHQDQQFAQFVYGETRTVWTYGRFR